VVLLRGYRLRAIQAKRVRSSSPVCGIQVRVESQQPIGQAMTFGVFCVARN
jgi:hypothetical protein